MQSDFDADAMAMLYGQIVGLKIIVAAIYLQREPSAEAKLSPNLHNTMFKRLGINNPNAIEAFQQSANSTIREFVDLDRDADT